MRSISILFFSMTVKLAIEHQEYMMFLNDANINQDNNFSNRDSQLHSYKYRIGNY